MTKLPENLDSRYRFVVLASLRAEQLQMGAVPRVRSKSKKPTVIAQEEVAAGLVQPYDPEQEAAAAEAADAEAKAEE